uniref:Uncharacterized protein n=1 Tax=Schistocephalus solidus TaxID=70667 RepID=A0A0X3PQS2_SCHSO
MIEVQLLLSPSVSYIPVSSLSTSNTRLMKLISAMADAMASLNLPFARITFSRSPSRRCSRSRPRTADVCWYHTNFAETARRCSFHCSLKYKKRKSVNQEIDATVFSSSSGSGRISLCLRQYDSQTFPCKHRSQNQRSPSHSS